MSNPNHSHHGGMDMHTTSPAHTNHMMHHSPTTAGHGQHGEDQHGDGHSDDTAGHVMMFHLRTDLNLLFEPWEISSTQVLVGSCIAVLVLSALYEGLKVFRTRLMRRTHKKHRQGTFHINGPPVNSSSRMFSLPHLSQTLLHVVQLVLGYLLMLVVMTYQVYLGVAVILGAGLGYFLFAAFMSTTLSSGKRHSFADDYNHPHPSPDTPVIMLKSADTNANKIDREMNSGSFPQLNDGFALENKGFNKP